MLASLALVAAIQNPLKQADTFPIAVWLQEPSLAAKYKAAGFNLYVGLWQGPTDAQLTALKAAGMPVFCEQNEVGLRHKADPTIAGWMHQDEPDNAQPAKTADGKDTWGPCVPPDKIVAEYKAMKQKDPSRPVMLNLGQGVANDRWYGRGNGAKLDDYTTYVQGADIVSFDVYPVAGLHDASKIGLVAKGIDRLEGWTKGTKRIWNCVECTNIDGSGKPTPAQVKAEVWSAIIHGSRGLIYFVHQFKPTFDEHALLDDPEMLAAVTKLNAQIQRFAPQLAWNQVPVHVQSASGAVEALAVARGKQMYVFAVSLSPAPISARMDLGGPHEAEVVDENRTARLPGSESESFEPYGLHVYRLRLDAR